MRALRCSGLARRGFSHEGQLLKVLLKYRVKRLSEEMERLSIALLLFIIKIIITIMTSLPVCLQQLYQIDVSV